MQPCCYTQAWASHNIALSVSLSTASNIDNVLLTLTVGHPPDHGCRWNLVFSRNLMMTDDAVLFAQDPGRWQAELKCFDDTTNTMGLHTSWEKTKLQNTGYGPPPQSVFVDGHPVEATDKFVYLGSTVDSNGYSNTDILRQIGLASSVMGQLDRLSLIHISEPTRPY